MMERRWMVRTTAGLRGILNPPRNKGDVERSGLAKAADDGKKLDEIKLPGKENMTGRLFRWARAGFHLTHGFCRELYLIDFQSSSYQIHSTPIQAFYKL
jgi:hypothetical protein